jgi:tRNA(Ile)-lysidine synthase
MVSGGSDSVALLRLADALYRDAYGAEASSDATASLGSPAFLRVLHVNHRLRGAEADGDEQFVVALSSQLGIPCIVKRADVAAQAAKTGEGIEQTGRTLRYRFAQATLDEFSAELGVAPSCGRILTAHTADDRAETLLQRLIVGGGGSSLASIPGRNGRIARPLLGCTRQELRSWLISLDTGIDGCLWREDASNLDTQFSRAFVRHELLPLLASRNPGIVEGLNRTATVLSDESAWMDTLALELLPLTQESFTAPLPLLRRAVYLACNHAIAEFAPAARITFEHVERIVRGGCRNGFACQIPGGIEVRTVDGAIRFSKARPPRHDPRK